MRYLAALMYAMAIAGGHGDIADVVGPAFCVGLGTLCALFAVEGIVVEALRPKKDPLP